MLTFIMVADKKVLTLKNTVLLVVLQLVPQIKKGNLGTFGNVVHR